MAALLLSRLGYEVPSTIVPKEASFAFSEEDLKIVELKTNENYRVEFNSKSWTIHTKVVLDPADIRAVACIAARFAPEGSSINLQADTHGAGNVFVGMIMSFGTNSIPINLVSGDIGCGLSILPVIKDGKHVKEIPNHAHFLSMMRRTLKRGKAAEDGAFLSDKIMKAIDFYGFHELPAWLDTMRYILDMVGIPFASYNSEDQVIYDNLTKDQSSVLQYIGRYAQSLGSSGNHFMELSVDNEGYYWTVVHSGSRGLGAKVYQPIAEACRSLTNGFEIATGLLAVFYASAYDALNKFAKLNRIMCAIAVLHDMGYETNATTLKEHMKASFMFAPAMERVGGDSDAMLSLMSGLTHNGIKAFVNDTMKEALFILSKGAIAMTKRASASIVALRAGDGCFVWTLADLTCQWREEDIQSAIAKVNQGYTVVHSCPDVIYSGHGAGRSRGTAKTAGMSTFEDIVAFYEETGVVGNVAPGVLGDNPRIAYNDVPTIMKHLPLDIACTQSCLKTMVSFKEGISYHKHSMKLCADYILEHWPTATDDRKLWLDINVCQQFMDKAIYTQMNDERAEILKHLDATIIKSSTPKN